MHGLRLNAVGTPLSCLAPSGSVAPFSDVRHGRLPSQRQFAARKNDVAVTALPEPDSTNAFPFLDHGFSFAKVEWRLALLGVSASVLGPGLGLGSGLDGTDPVSVAKALAILTVVVAVHECGHFLAARLQNIHVSKFSIGFGPPVVSYQAKEVQYSLRALPLGGFVAFPDDDPDCPYPIDDPDLLRNRPIRDRALVISAGVVANVLFAFLILIAQASTVGITTETPAPGVIVPKIIKDSAAEKAGILPGDVILSVDGRDAAPDPSTVRFIVDEIGTHANREMTFELRRRSPENRQSPPFVLRAIPAEGPDGQGRLGIQLVPNYRLSNRIAQNPVEAVGDAGQELLKLNGDILRGLRELVFNFSQSAEQVSGPVAIVALGAEVARLNAPQLYLFAAVVNLNLAVVNTLPLPALDGGYFALLLLELLRGGKKLPPGVEQNVTASGILFLVAVGCILVVRDIRAL